MSSIVTFGRSQRVLWRRVGTEVLVADPDASGISGLSAPASAAWMSLERPRTRDQLVDELVGTFGVTADEIAGHVERLLDQLVERGLVVPVIAVE